MYVCTYIYIYRYNMHICGQTNIHHPLIHCSRIILQCFCFCHLSARNTEWWFCYGGFFGWFLTSDSCLQLKSEQVWEDVSMHQSANWRAGRVESRLNTWLTFSPRKIATVQFEILVWFFSVWMQVLQKVMEMFLLTSVGVGWAFSLLTRFLFQLLCSPAHLKQER